MTETMTDLERFTRLQHGARIVFEAHMQVHELRGLMTLIRGEARNVELETRLGPGLISIETQRCRPYLKSIAAWSWAAVAELDGNQTPDGFFAIMDEARALYEAKNSDYGDSYKSHGSAGVVVRLTDKVRRADRLYNEISHEVKSESLRDTLLDLGNYCLMACLVVELERSSAHNRN
jgi:hypothetical protein